MHPAHGLLARLPPSAKLLADAAYDSNALRAFLAARGTLLVIPNNPTRKRFHPFAAPPTAREMPSSEPSVG
jgi:putative transposase